MKKQTALTVLAIMCSFLVLSQKRLTGTMASQVVAGASEIRYSANSTFPSFIAFNEEVVIDERPETWLKRILRLPETYGFSVNKSEHDAIGSQHLELFQYYKGVRVEYGVYKLHLTASGIQSINGTISPVGTVDMQQSISPETAIERAKSYMNAAVYKWESVRGNADRYLPATELVVLNLDKQAYLTYKVDIFAAQPLSRKYIYISAQTGEVVHTIEQLKDADVTGNAATAYSGPRLITMDQNGGTFTLQESSRNIVTLNASTGLPYTSSSSNWNLSGIDQYALDGHWGMEMYYDYLLSQFSRNSIDGGGMQLVGYMNDPGAAGNAFWTGTEAIFGPANGSNTFSPLTSIDVVAHEFTHGLTDFTSGLVYAGESGAMNESFSDIFAIAVTHFAKNTDLNDPATWLMGADFTQGTGIRDFINPNQFDCADTYGGLYWNNGDIVHFDSSVQNHWFYLLTMGGSGTNDVGSSYNVSGIGMADAMAIVYRTISFYLVPTSGFEDSRDYSILAASDLFGTCSPQTAAVREAWYAVGVGNGSSNPNYADFDYAMTEYYSCGTSTEPILVHFTDQSNPSTQYAWDFGDGSTSSQTSPSHTFAPGIYTVTLTVTGCDNQSHSTSQVINVSYSNLNPGPVNLVANQLIASTGCCLGTIYDSGSYNQNYGDNEYSSMHITVSNGSTIKMTPTLVDLEEGWDYLTIYDGADESAPILAQYSGYYPSGAAALYSSGNEVFVLLTSDASITANGFRIDWELNGLNLVLPDIILLGSSTYIVQPAYDAYQWYRNGVAIPGATNQIYTVTSAGDYYCVAYYETGCTSGLATEVIYSSVGVNELNKEKLIKVYPNPTTDLFHIDLSAVNDSDLRITNLLGETVYEQYNANGLVVVETGQWAPGNYFISIQNDAHYEVDRITVTE